VNFPIISTLNDLVPFIESNPQFRIQKQPNGFTVVCYMLQDEDTFIGENEAYAKECRGITFDRDGNIASRTLHKFQNVGENEQTQEHLIPWHDIVRVMDKRDGSMITFVEIDGKIVGKTKKTFTSAEAIAATEFLYKDPERVEWVRRSLQSGMTPTFEWTSPRFPIVLTYDKDELTLLQVRDNVTGEYDMDLIWWGVREDCKSMCPFPVIENIIDQFMWKMGGNGEGPYTEEFDFPKMKAQQLTKTGVEGWIVQAKNGEMWKVKTKWYCDLHHSVTFTRWRDVARTVLEDKSDDLKGAFAMTGRSIEPILEVERQIKEKIATVRTRVEEFVEMGRVANRTPKDMALALKGDMHFGLIMRLFRGQEINWMDWFLKEHINDFGLEVIPTSVQNEDTEVV